MNIRTFWLIILKIIGIFLVINGLSIVLQSTTTISSLYAYNQGNANTLLITAFTIVTTLIFYFFILWLFVFKTDWLIKTLQLEKGFDEDKINLSFQLKHVLNIAIIITGALLIIDSLPELCKQIFTFFQFKNIMNEQQSTVWIIFYFVKGILGYALITNSGKITSFIEQKAVNDNKDSE